MYFATTYMAVGTSNSLFFVEFELLSHTFFCRFVGRYENKSCEITYGPMDPTDQFCTLDNFITLTNNSDNMILNTVNVSILAPLAQTNSKLFCFTAIGKTPMFAIAVEGSFAITGIIVTVAKPYNCHVHNSYFVVTVALDKMHRYFREHKHCYSDRGCFCDKLSHNNGVCGFDHCSVSDHFKEETHFKAT